MTVEKTKIPETSTDVMEARGLTICAAHVNSIFGFLHLTDVGDVPDVSEVHTASIFITTQKMEAECAFRNFRNFANIHVV
jgi:hypothetical protein